MRIGERVCKERSKRIEREGKVRAEREKAERGRRGKAVRAERIAREQNESGLFEYSLGSFISSVYSIFLVFETIPG